MIRSILIKIVVCFFIPAANLQETSEIDQESEIGDELRCFGFLSVLLSPETAIGRLIRSGLAWDESIDHLSSAIETAEEEELKREVCYDQLGCFALEFPWFVPDSRPINLLPQDPDSIYTHFYLSTRREHGDRRQKLVVRPEVYNDWTDFDSTRWTVFITHGWRSNAGKDWVRHLETAILMRTDANVISVDWSFGGKGINYMQSVSNTRVVAAEISRLLNHLIAKKKLRADRVHLIGQSLGAHIMAYVGNNVTGIARITGLDPAQPGFEGDDPAVYLDASDAKFVDIIHTNADPFVPNGGLGFIQPTGHVDFYMNGGRSQPGCPGVKSKTGPITLIINTVAELLSTPIEMLVYYASCSHGRSYEYFIEAYTSNCTFWGRKWNPNTPEPPEEACRPDTCSALGQYTDLHSARGSFYVTTNQNPPFCIQPPDVPLDRLISNVKIS